MLEAPLVSQLLFVGVLSVNLAVLNVLPFPPLDGGRIAVVLLESVRRRKLPGGARGAHLPDRLRRPPRAHHPHQHPGHPAPDHGQLIYPTGSARNRRED